ncbi:MAG: hypothetical protein ACO294_11050 [Methylococcales bacterium]
MSDPFGLSEGAKTLSGSLDASREAGKGLTKSIEGIQKDGIDVAQKQAQERLRARREAELKKERALIKALEAWKHKKQISDEEADLKIRFVKAHGAKEWDAVLRIKLDIEKLEEKDRTQFEKDLNAVKRVQIYCFAVAAVVAWYITWGYKW